MKIFSKIFLLYFFILLSTPCLFPINSFADCRGCCSGHGGLVCIDGITMCEDGTFLSDICVNKLCDICPEDKKREGSKFISIASFNIQIFGKTKASKDDVMDVLAKIIVNFDIVAIQEIRDISGTAIKKLENSIDSLGEDYSVIVGERLGRTRSKEQYAYIYKTEVVELLGSYNYEEPENKDVFPREPFVGHFQVAKTGFDFTVITIHTDPDTAEKEIEELYEVVIESKSNNYFNGEEDIIILGDFNADCSYYDENTVDIPLRDSEEFFWVIDNTYDTNVAKSDCTYDRIVITEPLFDNYTGKAGVFEFDKIYEFDVEPKTISDHYP
ncbi:MAG: endonuclease/exonuclease/phosphatase family protein, partial [Candidatus Muiribacteriota bacterium]